MDYKVAVFIGRFQPFHNGHLQVIEHGLQIAERVIVLVGSATAASSPKNPFTYEERKTMILGASVKDTSRYNRVIVQPLRDYYYNENAWLADIQAQIDRHTIAGDPVVLIGSYKDRSSYYLKLFPQWEFSAAKTDPLNATDFRNALYELVPNKLRDWEGKVYVGPGGPNFYHATFGIPVPHNVKIFLSDWVKTKHFGDMAAEYAYVRDYKAQWANSPYPPTFVTTDAVVTCSGHVLVIKRKINPGKGLYALPGGFLREDEFIEDGMLRELREETGIRTDKLILQSSIVGERVFDHPDRSLRGRTISHGFHIKLKDGELPEVSANDDAAEVMWMSLWDVVANESSFFEDHAHIINYFTTVGAQGGR